MDAIGSHIARTSGNHPGYPIEWILIHCLGFGACWGWVHSAFFSGVLWGGSTELLGVHAWIVNVIANGTAMAAFGLAASRIGAFARRRAFTWTMVTLMVAGTLGLAGAETYGEPAAFTGAAASGVGSAGILLIWAECYARIAPGTAKKYTIPGSMAMGVLLFLIVNMMPFSGALATMVLLPAISVLLLHWSENRLPESRDDNADAEGTPENPTLPIPIAKRGGSGRIRAAVSIRFVGFVAVYCLAPGFLRGSTTMLQFTSSTSSGGEIFSGVAAAMLAISIASILLFKEQKVDLAYKLIVPFMAAGLLLLPFLDPGRSSLAGIAIMSGYILFEMYVWASLSDRAASVDAPTASVFGLNKAGMNLGLVAGTFLGMHFASSSSMVLVGASVFVIYLFIVLENVSAPNGGVSLSINADTRSEAHKPMNHPLSFDDDVLGSTTAPPSAQSAGMELTIGEAAKMNLSDAFESLLKEKCSTVTESHQLSKREADVLALLARGQSLQQCAQSLGVAYSTVKTHTDRIYQKTGVHSRYELMKLIEES